MSSIAVCDNQKTLTLPSVFHYADHQLFLASPSFHRPVLVSVVQKEDDQKWRKCSFLKRLPAQSTSHV